MIDINIDRYLEEISEEKIKDFLRLEENKIIYGDYNYFIDFLKRDNLCTCYICSLSSEKAMNFLQKLINCFKLKNINIDELFKLIKFNGDLKITRVSGWNASEILLINENLDELKIKCNFAKFKYTNKWGYETGPETYKIFNYNKNVLWIKKSNNEPQYFVLYKNKPYVINYKHKVITIFKNLENTFGNIVLENNLLFDDIIIKNESANISFEKTEIDLSNYFYKGFFYKGLLYNGNWEEEITILKNVKFSNGLIKIEIENLTYPHYDYVLLEIEDCKIITEIKE
jgi:hypothetical protein